MPASSKFDAPYQCYAEALFHVFVHMHEYLQTLKSSKNGHYISLDNIWMTGYLEEALYTLSKEYIYTYIMHAYDEAMTLVLLWSKPLASLEQFSLAFHE